MIFLVAGVAKFPAGLGTFAAEAEKQLAGKLPSILLLAFSYTLPLAEVLIRALLVLGVFTRIALVAVGALMLVLTFGVVLIPADPPTVVNNVLLALVMFVLQWGAEHNTYSLDQWLYRGGKG